MSRAEHRPRHLSQKVCGETVQRDLLAVERGHHRESPAPNPHDRVRWGVVPRQTTRQPVHVDWGGPFDNWMLLYTARNLFCSAPALRMLPLQPPRMHRDALLWFPSPTHTTDPVFSIFLTNR